MSTEEISGMYLIHRKQTSDILAYVGRSFDLQMLVNIFLSMNIWNLLFAQSIAGDNKRNLFSLSFAFFVQKIMKVEPKYEKFEAFWKNCFIKPLYSQSVII